MSAKLKIVFIGAGSMSFGMRTLGDIFVTPELGGCELALVDVDPEALDRMHGLALRMNEASGMGVKVTKACDRREALPGADFVVNSVAVKRCEMWGHDFRVPLKHGIKHCLGENGGPGALFFTMRTIPVIIDICRDMEELCPDAWFLNFSNPESRIILAVSKHTRIKCVGMCHGLFMAHHAVSHVLGMDVGGVRVAGTGINHFQWLTEIRGVEGNADLYPALREREASFDPRFAPLTRRMFRAFGYWPSCSDDHMGEYLSFGYEAGMHGYDFEADERNRARTEREIGDIVGGAADVGGTLRRSNELAVDFISAMHTGRGGDMPAAIVYNGGAISNLPADLAVEIPIRIGGGGITKYHVGDLPMGPAAMLMHQVGPQQLSVEAAVRGDRGLALQALLSDPVVNSTVAAERILDELWEINKPYIRRCV